MEFVFTEAAKLANGGTEQQARKLADVLKSAECVVMDANVYIGYIDKPVDNSKPSIYWIHDMPGDPAVHSIIRTQKFDAYVFVSHWQKNMFQLIENLPPSKCRVIPNCIDEPLPYDYNKWLADDIEINLIYFSTPHRGLDILVPTFENIYEEEGDKVHLHVASSFALYNQQGRDVEFASLFDKIKKHPGMTYHGSLSRDSLNSLLAKCHILAYPNTWPETSCRVLMEAMANGLMCVHPDLAALQETAGGDTFMYPFHEDKAKHQTVFQKELWHAIDDARSQFVLPEIEKIQPKAVKKIRQKFVWGSRSMDQVSMWADAYITAKTNHHAPPSSMITLRG